MASTTGSSAGRCSNRRRKQPPRRRRAAPTLALAAAVALALAGCGHGKGGTSAPPAGQTRAATPGGVTLAEARAVLARYVAANNAANAANAALDVQAIQRIEAAPASVVSATGLKILKSQQGTAQAVTYQAQRFAFPPPAPGAPRWFVALVSVTSTGGTVHKPKYLLFRQQSTDPGAPWQVAYYPTVLADQPPPALDGDGQGNAIGVVPSALLLDPAGLPRAIYDTYAHGSSGSVSGDGDGDGDGDGGGGVQFAATLPLQILDAGYATGVQTLASQGVTLHRSLLPTAYPTYLVRTADGGALAFVANQVRDRYTPKAPGTPVRLDQGSREAAVAGRPQGLTASQVTVTRTQVFLCYVPPRSNPGAGVQILSYDDVPDTVVTS